MVLFVDFAGRKPDTDQNSDGRNILSRKIFKLVNDIIRKSKVQIIRSSCHSILIYGNKISFSWMAYFSKYGAERIYCSITTHDVTDDYEINISCNQIVIYSYNWQNYAMLFTKPIDHEYILQDNSEFVEMLAEFKIVLFDIMQDVFATLSDEFYILNDVSFENQHAQKWFNKADNSVQIRKAT